MSVDLLHLAAAANNFTACTEKKWKHLNMKGLVLHEKYLDPLGIFALIKVAILQYKGINSI